MGRRWASTVAAAFGIWLCLALSARGAVSAVHGRPEFGLLALFGVVGCAVIVYRWSDIMATTATITVSRTSSSIRFMGMSARERSRLRAPKRGPVDVRFDTVKTLEVRHDTARTGQRRLVVVVLTSPPDLALTLDDDLGKNDAEELVEIVKNLITSEESAASVTTALPAENTPRSRGPREFAEWLFRGLSWLGVVTFLAGFVTSVYPMPFLDSIELPLGAPAGLLEDDGGRIVVGSRSYLRLQRYLPNGEFDRSWRAPEVKGEWRLALAENGAYVLRSLPSGCWTITEHGTAGPHPCAEDLVFGGMTVAPGLEIKSWPFRVLRGTEVVVSQNLLLNLVRSPMPAFLWLVLGLAGQLWLRHRS